MLPTALAVTFLAGLRTLGGQFVYDDHEMILLNRYIGQGSFLWDSLTRDVWWFRNPAHLPQSSYYRPVQDLWLGLNYRLFGLNPVGWHVGSLILHLVAVAMVFKLGAAMLKDSAAAFIAALFFGVLAVHAETVAWISAAPLLLVAVFELGAFYCIARHDRMTRGDWTLSLLLYGTALLSHESAIAFPGIIALYLMLIKADFGSKKQTAPAASVRERAHTKLNSVLTGSLPYAALATAYLLLRLWVLGFITRANPGNHMTAIEGFLTIPAVLAHFIALLLMPWLAGPSHRVLPVADALSRGFIVPLGFIGALTAAGALRLIYSPRRRFYLFCGFWLAIALIPQMDLRGLVQNDLVHDRYLYFPSVSLCWLIGAFISETADYFSSSKRFVYAAAGAAALTCTGFFVMSIGYWHDEVALFSRAIAEFPDDAIWHTRLGMALEQRGKLSAALSELEEANRLEPRDAAGLFDLAQLHARLGKFKLAELETAKSLSLLPDPTAGEYTTLAMLAAQAGDTAETEHALETAASLPGGTEEAALARARISLAHSDSAGALALLNPLAEKSPGDLRVWSLLGAARGAAHDYEGALAAYQHAIALGPAEMMPRYFAAQTLHQMGRDDAALTQSRIALELAPNDPDVLALIREIQRSH